MSLLDRFDPVFTATLGCWMGPPYPTAEDLAQTIDERIEEAGRRAEEQFNELQRTDSSRPDSINGR